jgi:hypothetical protein
MTDLLSRLLSRCERQSNGCLDWLGVTARGYGRIWIDGRGWYVHRLMWELQRGPIPSGLCCLHSCDRPICCEIQHLSLGTQQDNVDDMIARGRQAKGSAQGSSKLTSFKVWQIRKIISLGRFSDPRIAEMFGVEAGTIRSIRYRHSWAWLRHNPHVPIIDLIPPLTFRRRI